MTVDEVLRAIEGYAPGRGLPIIGPERGLMLEKVVAEKRPSRVLEIGTLVGYSAIRIARQLGPRGTITCVELDERMAKEARENLQRAGLSEKVDIKTGDARKVIPTLKGTFDLVFVDAAKDQYRAYLAAFEPLISKGSVVIADNVKSFAGEMADYLKYVRTSGSYQSRYLEAPSGGDALEVSIRL